MYVFVYKPVGQQIKYTVLFVTRKLDKILRIRLVLQKFATALQCVVQRAVISSTTEIVYNGFCAFVVVRAIIQIFYEFVRKLRAHKLQPCLLRYGKLRVKP